MAKVKEELLKKNIQELSLSVGIITILNNNNINCIGDLWSLNRKILKGYGMKDSDINQIIIKLQLLGLDLNRKMYK